MKNKTPSPTVHVSNNLATWKTVDLLFFKEKYLEQIADMDRIRESLGLKIEDMTMRIEYADLKNIFIARFNRDMLKAIKYVEVITAELQRRKALIGNA